MTSKLGLLGGQYWNQDVGKRDANEPFGTLTMKIHCKPRA